MSNIDKRVVQMEFDNKQFEKDMKTTVKSLRNFENNLNSIGGSSKAFDGISKGLTDVKSNVKGFNLNPISDAFGKVKVTISGWEMAAMAAINNVVNGAMNAAKNMAKSLITDPISQGMQEYELKMNSVQTMLLGAQAIDPSVNLDKVNEKLDELNTYADRTIYSFSDMTQNIGKFINAGVGLDDAVAAIQGVSNVAAISGANANEASRAMYNFSQALSTGYVKLIDWKSIENANMATVEFKNQLIDTAVEMGTLVKEGNYYISTTTDMNGKVSEAFNSTKAFNDSLSHQWMTTDVLTATLKKYTDETTELGKKAFQAATEVKTFSQLMDTLKEAVGSGWAQTWEAVFGDFNEAKTMWTSINNVVGGFIDKQSQARVELLKTWKEMGGRNTLIESLKNAFENIGNVLNSVKEAFQDVFPPLTANRLVSITRNFSELVTKMEFTKDELKEIRDVFKSVFSAIKNAIVPVFKAWKEAFPIGTVGGFAKKLLSLMGTINKSVTDLFNSLTNNGEVIHKIATVLFTILRTGMDVASAIISATKTAIKLASPLINFFSRLIGFTTDLSLSFVHLFKGSKNITSAFSRLSEAVEKVTAPIQNGLTRAFEALYPYLDKFKKWVDDAANWLSDRFANAVDALAGTLLGLVEGLDKSGNGLKNVSNSAKDASNKISVYKSKVGGAIGSIIDSLRSNTIISSIISGIKTVFSTIWEYIKKFAEGVNNTLSPIIEKFKTSGAIGSFKEAIKSVATTIGDSTKSIIQSAGPAKDALLKLFGAGNLLDLIQKFVSIYTQLKLGKLAGGLGSFLDKLAEKNGILDQVKKGFESFVNGIKKPLDQISKKQQAFKSFATSVLMIATSLYLVSKIPVDNLKTTVLALTKIITIFAAITVALDKITNNDKNAAKNLAAMSLLFVAFAEAIKSLLITTALISLVINKVSPESAKTALNIVGTITKLIGTFVILFAAFSKKKLDAKQILAYSLIIKVIGNAIKSIALVVAILSLFNAGKVWSAGIVISIITGVLMAGLVLLFSKGSAFGMKAPQILAMTMLMKVVGDAIKSIALVIAILSLFDQGKVWNAAVVVTVIGGLLGGLIYLTKYINTDFKKLLALSAYMKVVGGAIKSIALVIAILSLPIFSPENLAKGSIVVAAISAILGGLMLLTKVVNGSNAKKSAQAMLILSAAIAVVSLAVIKLSKIDLGQAIAILGALTVAFGLLGGALIGMSKFAKGIEKLGKAFMLFGVGVAAFGGGIYLIVKAVKIMNKLGPQGIQTMTDMITALMANLPKWLEMLITGTLEAISKSIPDIARSLVDILVSIVNTVTQNAATIISAIVNMFKAIATALSSAGSGFDIADLFWAIQAIALIAGLIFVLQYISSDMKAALKGIGLMALVLAALVGSLILINQFTNPDKTIEILSGMAVAMVGLAAVFGTVALIGALINKISGGSPKAGAMALLFGILGFAAFLLVSVLVVGIIGAVLNIWAEDEVVGTFEKAIKVMRLTGQAIGTFMGSIVSSFANIVSNSDASIAMLLAIVPVILALEPLMLVLPMLTLFIGAIGALGTLLEDTFNWDLVTVFETAAEIMGGIGNALGQFIGGFIRGVMEQLSQGLMDSLITFADGLSEFMVHLQPFIDAVKQLDAETLGSVGILTLIILEMAAAELISAVTGFLSGLLGGSKSIVSFAEELEDMAPHLVNFSNILEKGKFNGDLVTIAANAALMLSKVANNLPKSGGIFQFFTGTTMSMTEFGSKLEGLGESLVKFGNKVLKLEPKNIVAIGTAATAVSRLSDVAKNMPKDGGLWQRITGSNIQMDKFGQKFESLGESLVKFSKSVSSIKSSDVDKTKNAIPVVESLVEIANDMPKDGGIWQSITGHGLDLDEFGEKLPKLGEGLLSFVDSVKGIDASSVETSKAVVGVCEQVVEIADKLNDQKSGGIVSWFEGESEEDLESFSKKLPTFGEGIANFVDKTKDVDNIDNISTIVSAITQLTTAFTTAKGVDDISEFTSSVQGLAEQSDNFIKISNLFGTDNENVQLQYKRMEAIGNAVKAMANGLEAADGVDTDNIDTFNACIKKMLEPAENSTEPLWMTFLNIFGNNEKTEAAKNKALALEAALGAIDKAASVLVRSKSRVSDIQDFIDNTLTPIANAKDDINTFTNLFGDNVNDINKKGELASAVMGAFTKIHNAIADMKEVDSKANITPIVSMSGMAQRLISEHVPENIEKLLGMFGNNDKEVEAKAGRMKSIGDIFDGVNSFIAAMSNEEAKSADPSKFISNVTTLWNNRQKIVDLSNLYSKDEYFDTAKARMEKIKAMLTSLGDVFNAQKESTNLSSTFLQNIKVLWTNRRQLVDIANIFGDDNGKTEAAKNRIEAVGKALNAIGGVFLSVKDISAASIETFIDNIYELSDWDLIEKLHRISNMFCNKGNADTYQGNKETENAKKRIQAVGIALSALSTAFNGVKGQSTISETFLKNILALTNPQNGYINHIIEIADMFGKDKNDAEAYRDKLDIVTDALDYLVTVFNLSTANDLKGTFFTNISNLYSYREQIKEISDIFGTSNDDVNAAKTRLTTTKDALLLLKDTFNGLSGAQQMNSYFTASVKDLIDCDMGGDLFGSFMRISKMLGDDNGTSKATKERIENVSAVLTSLATGFEDTQKANANGFSDFVTSLQTLSSVSLSTVLDNFSDTNTQEVINQVKGFISRIGQTFLDKKKPLANNVTSLTNVVYSTVAKNLTADNNYNGGKGKTASQFTAVIEKCMSEVKKYGNNEDDAGFYGIGKYLIAGLLSGIESNKDKAVEAGKAIAKFVAQGSAGVLEVKSPSRLYRNYFAPNIVKGLVLGLDDQSKDAFDAGSNLAQNAANGTKSIIGRISNIIDSDMNLQPVISPILDLSDVSSQSGRIGGILNAGSTISMANRTSSLIEQGRNIRLDARLLQNESPDVVAAINELTNRMDSLENTIVNRPIMLDKTKVSKEITPEIDKNLGRRAYYSRRGN